MHRFRGVEVSEDSEEIHLPCIWSTPPLTAGPQGVLMFSSGYYLESSMTLAHRNRCIECPDASKTIGNQLPMKKYIGAVLRKSFQLEVVTEIGPFVNDLKLVFKKTLKIKGKDNFKKSNL